MIKENVSGFYQGTRDILWALNPESDLIREIGQGSKVWVLIFFRTLAFVFLMKICWGIREC